MSNRRKAAANGRQAGNATGGGRGSLGSFLVGTCWATCESDAMDASAFVVDSAVSVSESPPSDPVSLSWAFAALGVDTTMDALGPEITGSLEELLCRSLGDSERFFLNDFRPNRNLLLP